MISCPELFLTCAPNPPVAIAASSEGFPASLSQQIPIYSSISIMVGQDFLRRLNVPDLEEISHCIKNASAPLLVSVGAIAAATTYYLATRPKALAPLCDLHRQSVEVEVG